MQHAEPAKIREFRRNLKSSKRKFHHFFLEPKNYGPSLPEILSVYNKVRSVLPEGDLRL